MIYYCAVCFYFLLYSVGAVPKSYNNNLDSPIKDKLINITVENNSIPRIKFAWHFREKSYYVGDILLANYLEAIQFCNFHGMCLLSILSKEENDFLGERLYDDGYTGDFFWTSGTRAADSQHWVWLTTGTRIKFSHWGPGEPNKNEEKCLEIHREYNPLEKKKLFWNDSPCASKRYFICEFVKSNMVTHQFKNNITDVPSV